MAADYSDNLFQQGQQIVFYHEWSGITTGFKAFDLDYSESVTNDWEETALPRRINRRYAWTGVTRNISLSWSLPAFNEAEAANNLQKCSTLVRMMYPKYDYDTRRISNGSSLWFLSVMNLAHNSGAPMGGSSDGGLSIGGSLAETGLAGFPSNFSFNIDRNEGFFEMGDGEILPKHISVNMSYTVILDDSKMFGWYKDGYVKWSSEASYFPWSGASSTNSSSDSDGGDQTDAESNSDTGGANTL